MNKNQNFLDKYGIDLSKTTINDKWHNTPFCHFYGYAYGELIWKWNMPVDDDNDMEYIEWEFEYILKYLTGIRFLRKRKNKFYKQAMKDIRYFVSGLGESAGLYAPFWKGLSNVSNDMVFLQLFSTCFGHAWT